MVSRRLRLLNHYLKGRRNGTSAFDALRVIFGPTCSMKARPYIRDIRTDGEFCVVRFRDYEMPLFVPKNLDLRGLYQVVTEQMTGNDWHRYEAFGTNVGRDEIILDC